MGFEFGPSPYLDCSSNSNLFAEPSDRGIGLYKAFLGSVTLGVCEEAPLRRREDMHRGAKEGCYLRTAGTLRRN